MRPKDRLDEIGEGEMGMPWWSSAYDNALWRRLLDRGFAHGLATLAERLRAIGIDVPPGFEKLPAGPPLGCHHEWAGRTCESCVQKLYERP